MSEDISQKELIFNAVDDLVSDFLYYDRKEDEDLPLETIEKAIRSGEITTKEIVEKFREVLDRGIGHG